jgi:hypothetical protein
MMEQMRPLTRIRAINERAEMIVPSSSQAGSIDALWFI